MTNASQGPLQAEHWNGKGGEAWVRRQELLDKAFHEIGGLALDAAKIRPGARVIDVGCGCGDTTIEAGERVGAEGLVVGVDLSGPMLSRAAERAELEGLEGRLAFHLGDAGTYAFEPASFDAVVSRFGVMFFDDPKAAFTNLARALRPGGVVAFVCWRPLEENPWATVPLRAVRSVAPATSAPPPEDAPGPFAFARPERVRAVLEGAGFVDVTLRAEDRVVPFGPDGPRTRPEEVLAYALEIGPAARAVAELDADTAATAKAALAEALGKHAQSADDASVRLGAAVWVVTARKPG